MAAADQSEEVVGWRDLLGANNWDGLLDPLNDDLRRLILRCGDFCQVTYDTFINDQNSDYCGSSRYGKEDLLQKTAFPQAEGEDNYKVVGYLYATARVSVPEAFLLKSMSRERWDRESNWIGYIAVSNDEFSKQKGRREIYVAWRGTIRDYEWVDVLGAKLDSAKTLLRKDDENGDGSKGEEDSDEKVPRIMQGWLTIYESDDPKSPFTKLSARTQLLNKLKGLIDEYKGEDLSITFCGHSLGATLSVVSVFDVAENLTSEIPITALVFGCPKVGNKAFKDKFESYPNVKVLHIRNTIDLIPHYPGALMGYVNIGTELVIDTRKSNYLKDSKNPSDWHNLQAMLHVVNGWHGENRDFALVIKRSIALVNKSCGFLMEECRVPESWWIQKNKGLVLNQDGDWVLAPPEVIPLPEFD